MSAPVFLADRGDLGSAVPGGEVAVEGAEGRHAVRSLRLSPGEPVEVVDGAGRRVSGTVVSTTGTDRFTVRVLAVLDEPPPSPRLVVVQALPKGERGELAVELLTEVGVDVVVPWPAARCVAVWRGDRADRGLARWRGAARSAAKQARRARVPDIEAPADLADVAERVRGAALALVLHESARTGIADLDVPESGDVVLVVGPEGGLTDEEVTALTAAGGRAVRLGPTVLRTSTAGVVAAAALLPRTPRWRE